LERSLDDFASEILRKATWSAAAGLGIRTITGRKRAKRWIPFKSTLVIEDSDSSKKISASGCAAA
jgi:hypothetical protein